MLQIIVRKRTVLILLTLIGLLAYFNSFGVPFHYDDISFLREKTIIKSSALFSQWIKEDYSRIISGRAFLLFTFYLNYVINGLDTFGYHLVNLLIHVSTAFLFYLLVAWYIDKETYMSYPKSLSCRLVRHPSPICHVGLSSILQNDSELIPDKAGTRVGMTNPTSGNDNKRDSGNDNFWGFDKISYKGVIAASLFLLHPINTESVTYISSRSSVLSAFFVLLSILCFFRATTLSDKSPHPINGGSNAPSYPPLKLRGGRWSYDGSAGEVIGEKVHAGYYTLSILFFLLGLSTKEAAIMTPMLILLCDIYFVSDKGKNFKSRIKYHLPFWVIIAAGFFYYTGYITRPAMYDRPWQTHILTELKVFVVYLKLLILPLGLNICHYMKESSSLFDTAVILSAGIITGLLLIAILLKNKNRLLSFSVFWFFINLIPFLVIRLEDYMAERWVYTAAMGFSLGVSELLVVLYFKYKKIGAFTIGCLAIFLGVLTYMRNDVYRDPIALWTDALKKSPERHRPYSNLSASYLERGDTEKVIEITELSIKKGNREIALYLNLANAYFLKGNFKKTEEILLSLTNKGEPEVYYKLGVIYILQKKYEKAIGEFEKVVKIRPYSPAAFGSIGECYNMLGWRDKAKEYFILATEGIPQNSEDYLMLAKSYFNLGDEQKGAESLDKALISDPFNIYIRNMIADILFNHNRFDGAYKHFSVMAKLSPNYTPAYTGMGKAMLATGNLKEARGHFNKALSLLPPDSPERKELLELLTKTQG